MIRINPKLLPDNFYFLVSGGLDSIASAHWLNKVFKRKFHVIHFNHNVQEINKRMWETVCDFSNHLGLSYSVYHLSPQKTSESALRELRHNVFRDCGGNYITAHHIGDCVEQYLMNTFKGCPERMPMEFLSDFNNYKIYHPFLKVSKKDFQAYADANDLGRFIVEDPTNHDPDYCQRNLVRNTILPLIETNIETVVRKKFYQ